MSRKWLSALALLAIAFPNIAESQGLRTVSYWHGDCNGDNVNDQNEFCNATFCEGEFLRCPDGEDFNFGSLTFYYLEGVCDDGDPGATACDGRFVSRFEECIDPVRDTFQLGTIFVNHPRGAYRICFDTNGDTDGLSDCAGDDATLQAEGAIIIQEGSYLSNNRVHGEAGDMFIGESTFFDLTSTKFTDPVDGKKKSLSNEPGLSLFSGDVEDVEPFTCAVSGSSQLGK